MKIDLSFIQESLPKSEFKFFGKKEISPKNFLEENKLEQFCVDSRKLKQNSVFVALQGEKVDGHDFIEQALEKGAIVVIAKKDKQGCIKKITSDLLENKLFIFVDDGFDALIILAKNWRQKFNIPVIGITGSIGKTSTKKMLEHILKQAKIPAYISVKNQNTNIGLSLNILNMNSEHRVAVFELGISRAGEMAELADILQPTIAVITKISHSHTLSLGKLEEVAVQKKLIFKNFKTDNVGIICGDDDLLIKSCYRHPVIRFGLKTKNHINARKVEVVDGRVNFILKIYSKKQKVRMQTSHVGAVNNALAATAVSSLLNISNENIINGIENFKGFDNRFEEKIILHNRGIFISDCYNANPESMKAAILAFGRIKKSGPKIAILGDMLELGIGEKFWHRQVGRFLARAEDLDFVILVGKNAKLMEKTSPINLKIYCAKDWKQAKEKLCAIFEINKNQKHLVLVKASRGMMLDKIVDQLSCS